MTRAELVDAIAAETAMAKADAEKLMTAFQTILGRQLKAGEKVNIFGFGVFQVSKRKARVGRNPKTGAAIDIPESKTPKFRAGRVFKEAIQ